MSPPSRLLGRLAVLLEVTLAFTAVHVTYRSFKHFTPLGQDEVAAGLNFSTGATMILFTVAFLLVTGRRFVDYGLTLQGWRYHVPVGLLWTLIVVTAGAALVRFSPIRLDPLHPPDLPRAVVVSLGELVLVLLLALFLRRERRPLQVIPPALSLAVLVGLLLLTPVLAVAFHRPLVPTLLSVLWLFFGAGLGEETFFRGYIQSRVNEVFGRPFTVLGVHFGVGLLVSSLLFGFIHALNTVDYFQGRYDFAWLWMAGNFCAGLFFGVLRERSGSILPGVISHGLEDVLGHILTLLP